MTTAIEPRPGDVLSKLLLRSREGKLSWRKLTGLSSLFGDQYEASVPSWSILLSKRQGSIVASIRDSQGQLAASISDSASDETTVHALRELFAEAQKLVEAQKLGEVLGQLDRELDRL